MRACDWWQNSKLEVHFFLSTPSRRSFDVCYRTLLRRFLQVKRPFFRNLVIITVATLISTMSNNVENLSPQIIRRVVKEMQDLVQNPPEGIKVQINDEDVTDIQAYIDGPAGTPYMSGVFKVKLTLGKGFPQEPPKAFFLTKIFHPNVASNGEICVNTLKKDWKSDLGIKHILLTIKCLLIVPNAESALNEEAGKLLLEHYEDYSQRAKMMTEIHAQPQKISKDSSSEGPLAKKPACDKKLTAEKKKILKDKKRTLKRL